MPWKFVLPLTACLALAACQPFAITVAGAGASALIAHKLNGASYRTFTASLPAVKRASLGALKRMGIALDSTETFETGEILLARAEGRSVEIELEPISPRATRMRVTTRDGGLFYDNATATEIVAQTQKMLAAPVVTKVTAQARRVGTD